MRLFALWVAFLLADAANMGRIARRFGSSTAGRIVIRFVQTQILRFLFGRLRTFDHNGVERYG